MAILILGILMILFAMVTNTTVSIPIVVLILWLEVNIYGTTIMPELLCIFNFWLYIVGRLLWISILGTNTHGNKRVII